MEIDLVHAVRNWAATVLIWGSLEFSIQTLKLEVPLELQPRGCFGSQADSLSLRRHKRSSFSCVENNPLNRYKTHSLRNGLQNRSTNRLFIHFERRMEILYGTFSILHLHCLLNTDFRLLETVAFVRFSEMILSVSRAQLTTRCSPFSNHLLQHAIWGV